MFLNLRTTDAWAAGLGRRNHSNHDADMDDVSASALGELWTEVCLLEEFYTGQDWLDPYSIPLLGHLLGHLKRNVILVTTTNHWPNPRGVWVQGVH